MISTVATIAEDTQKPCKLTPVTGCCLVLLLETPAGRASAAAACTAMVMKVRSFDCIIDFWRAVVPGKW